MEKICSVNNKGKFTFIIEGILPENVPKVKHPPRELNEAYKSYLRADIENRVKLKKHIIEIEKSHERKLLEIERDRLTIYKRNIEKWFNN